MKSRVKNSRVMVGKAERELFRFGGCQSPNEFSQFGSRSLIIFNHVFRRNHGKCHVAQYEL